MGFRALMITAAAALAAVFALSVYAVNLSNGLPSQYAAERFSGDSGTRFAQISVFYPSGKAPGADTIRSFREKLTQKLTADGISAAANAPLYRDAWSAAGNVTLGNGNISVNAAATFIGGDFFAFHPLRIADGGYISESDAAKDRVVLDETAAWKLFGSNDAAGMSVTVNGAPYFTAGVVRREEDGASALSLKTEYAERNPEGAGVFPPFEAAEGFSVKGFMVYEVVMPNPIKGYALDFVKRNAPSGGEVIENTGRFALSRVITLVTGFGKNFIRVNEAAYPYWENAARIIEGRLALISVICGILFLPVLCGIICLIVKLIGLLKSLWARIRLRIYGEYS